jgi:hypothetical protein
MISSRHACRNLSSSVKLQTTGGHRGAQGRGRNCSTVCTIALHSQTTSELNTNQECEECSRQIDRSSTCQSPFELGTQRSWRMHDLKPQIALLAFEHAL